MPAEDKSKNHHYVPQNILRKFSYSKKGKVYVFDKHKKIKFKTNIRNILSENRFNEFQFGDNTINFEAVLTELEGGLWSDYERVVSSENLFISDSGVIANLSILMAFQYMRAKQFRESIKGVSEGLRESIEKMGQDPDNVLGAESMSENDIKVFSTLFLTKYLPELSKVISSKKFLLIKTTKENAFYIGDNPVVLFNMEEKTFRGNLGLESKGIQIYMPLSSTLTIAALCPTVVAYFYKTRREIKEFIETNKLNSLIDLNYKLSDFKSKSHELEIGFNSLNNLINSIESGVPYECSVDNVHFHNSLQVRYSYRHLINCTDEFDVAEKICRDATSDIIYGKMWNVV
jgi:hypothetical protein